MDPLNNIKISIRRIEERPQDSWVDMSLRKLRKGQVRFYRVNDPLTGQWLFKACYDDEMRRTIIKALKCPPGGGFVQLEGRTMLFQKSLLEGYSYDVISLSYLDEKERLRRNVVANAEEVPETILNNFKVVDYEEATGKKAIGKKLVTLCEERDEKKMIMLFLLQRAWPISKVQPETAARMNDLLKSIKDLERAMLNEVYSTAEEKFGLTKEDTDLILGLLEAEGKIQKFEEYVKTKP
ncbi:hypothetical protein B6U79_03820 [Candidatus Bathyarchaeota archaeon ex4484_231]|nr:MAG: hypothetical protein B6U79_03820 [Candidatus Bathyarchaeota archaeon ex4484_231]